MGSNPIPENEIFSILFLRSGSCAVRHIFSICILVRTTLHHILFTYLIKHTNPLQLLIPTTSVLRITKEKVARIIPNAVGVCTRDERHVFGSLLSRDSTYKLMTHVWKATKAPELAVPKPEVCVLSLSIYLSISLYVNLSFIHLSIFIGFCLCGRRMLCSCLPAFSLLFS